MEVTGRLLEQGGTPYVVCILAESTGWINLENETTGLCDAWVIFRRGIDVNNPSSTIKRLWFTGHIRKANNPGGTGVRVETWRISIWVEPSRISRDLPGGLWRKSILREGNQMCKGSEDTTALYPGYSEIKPAGDRDGHNDPSSHWMLESFCCF